MKLNVRVVGVNGRGELDKEFLVDDAIDRRTGHIALYMKVIE